MWNVNKLVHRLTLRQNRRGMVVAQDNTTASELFGYAEVIYDYLPDTHGPLSQWIKPPTVNRRSSTGGEKYIHWGEPARDARARGERGVDSRLVIDTAKEVSAGRGMRLTDLLATEVAFWPDPDKALSLVRTVPDAPGTLVVMESTANGHNFFKTRWDNAVAGVGSFTPIFISWLEDPNSVRQPDDADDAERFWREDFGRGPYGEDEPRLLERMLSEEFGFTRDEALLRLLWRRFSIADIADGDLARWKQEEPSTPLEAFIGSGKHVFSISFIEKAEQEAKLWDPLAESGLLVASDWTERRLMTGTVDVPTGTLWLPESADTDPDKPRWKVWQQPQKGGEGEKPGAYIAFVDVAAGEEMTTGGDTDYHAIQIIDHLTGEQVAEWRSRIDRDLLALEAVLAGLYWNTALLAVEITGGYGLGVAEDLWKKYGYRRLYKRRLIAQTRDRPQRALGWDTTRKTKPRMEDNMAELLREGANAPENHVIRSLALVNELKTYVRFENGRHGADVDQHDDLLMAFMGAQRVRDLERAPAVLSSPAPGGPELPSTEVKRYG
jgi:hypothetical protein